MQKPHQRSSQFRGFCLGKKKIPFFSSSLCIVCNRFHSLKTKVKGAKNIFQNPLRHTESICPNSIKTIDLLMFYHALFLFTVIPEWLYIEISQSRLLQERNDLDNTFCLSFPNNFFKAQHQLKITSALQPEIDSNISFKWETQ